MRYFLIDRNGEVTGFSTRQRLEEHVESPDALADEYQVFDELGRRYELLVPGVKHHDHGRVVDVLPVVVGRCMGDESDEFRTALARALEVHPSENIATLTRAAWRKFAVR